MDNLHEPKEALDELPVCVHCGCSIKDGVPRVWQEISTGNVAFHMYYSACIAELNKRVKVLEGKKLTQQDLDNETITEIPDHNESWRRQHE